MRKNILYLLLLALTYSSCEKDDFCIDPVTPNFIIRFYDDANNTNTKTVSGLYVWPEGKDSLYVNSTTDSIAIPLDVINSETVYNLSRGTLQDQITINYTINEVFVSRSCGFKATFSDVATNANTNNWILNIIPSTTTVENETAAHVQIFH